MSEAFLSKIHMDTTNNTNVHEKKYNQVVVRFSIIKLMIIQKTFIIMANDGCAPGSII